MSKQRSFTGSGAGMAVLVTIAMAALATADASAKSKSLYRGPGHRPGPDILYRAPARAPQLVNRGVWEARPILVSGATAYRRGEFLYQDFLYDDHGANGGLRDPRDPRPTGHLFSQPNGTYFYPSDPAYANNAADLVEFRVKPLADATAFRLTLNTMKDPSLIGATIAIGDSAEPRAFPHGANASAPAQLFLTVHGDTADLVNAADGAVVDPAPQVSVNSHRRQIQVLVSHQAWNPGKRKIRFAMGVGLWDRQGDRYLIPQGASDATHPGGAGTLSNPTAFFNVAFRAQEPSVEISNVSKTAQDPSWWRDSAQGTSLKTGDLSPFRAVVSFRKLRKEVRDNSGVPRKGPIDRILASHFETAQGVDYGSACLVDSADCPGEYQGRLQPYAIYVPRSPVPKRGYGMTLLLHSLSTNYNQFLGSRNQSQFGERGPGSIVITPEARGPDGSYDSYAGADVFEVWADVARRYRLDPAWTSIAGYSMGGFGTFKLAEQFPDLFARAQPTVGAETTTYRVASLRNVPVLMWNGAADELVNPALYMPTAQMLDSLGYRYELDVFVPGEHNSLAINDEFAPAATFLGTARVDRNPDHVTFAVDPGLDHPELGFVADHAYWLSGLKVRDASAHGMIDAISHGFGEGDPNAAATQRGGGSLDGGYLLPSYPYADQSRAWGPAPSIGTADRIDIDAENIAAMTIKVKRARVGCDVQLNVKTDGPLSIRLAGCGRTVQAG